MDLSRYNNDGYSPGASLVKRVLWYWVNAIFFHSWLCPLSGVKCFLLRCFGSKVGRGVVLKPRVNIKYPWNLEIGDHVWIGEGCWIDNLDVVKIGSNVCVSQDAYLLTGNHDYTREEFSLITRPIELCDGVWVGAKSIVCPGVIMNRNSILTVGSVLNRDAVENSVYQGNFATRIKQRSIG